MHGFLGVGVYLIIRMNNVCNVCGDLGCMNVLSRVSSCVCVCECIFYVHAWYVYVCNFIWVCDYI